MRAPRGFGEFYAELSRSVVAYHPRLVKVTGGVTATILLDQLLYWSARVSEESQGWIYKTQAEIEDETGLTRFEQETARKKLRDRGIVGEKRAGVPARLFFRVDLERLSDLYEEAYPLGEGSAQDAGFPQTRMRKHSILKSRRQDAGDPAAKRASSPHTSITENTSSDYDIDTTPNPLQEVPSANSLEPGGGEKPNSEEPGGKPPGPPKDAAKGDPPEAFVADFQVLAQRVRSKLAQRGRSKEAIDYALDRLDVAGKVTAPAAWCDKLAAKYDQDRDLARQQTLDELARTEQEKRERLALMSRACNHGVQHGVQEASEVCDLCREAVELERAKTLKLLREMKEKVGERSA